MLNLLLTDFIPDDLRAALSARFVLHDLYQRPDREALLSRVAGEIDAIVQGGATILPVELLDRLPQLKLVAICGVGFDGVPLTECALRGVAVTNTPSVLTEDVADIGLALVLMTCRNLLYANRFLRDHRWEQGEAELATRLEDKHVGILGMGRIGHALAARLEACHMHIAYTGRHDQHLHHPFVPSLLALARQSDILVIACPGGPQTRHLVDAAVLEALGPSGILINVGRGSVVDENALIEALQGGRLRSAGIDAFDHEPRVDERLLALDNVVLLPHVGSATRETRARMARLCFDNIDAFSRGAALVTPVSLPPSPVGATH